MKNRLLAAGLAAILGLTVAACDDSPDVDIDNTDTTQGVGETVPTVTTVPMDDTSTTAPAG